MHCQPHYIQKKIIIITKCEERKLRLPGVSQNMKFNVHHLKSAKRKKKYIYIYIYTHTLQKAEK